MKYTDFIEQNGPIKIRRNEVVLPATTKQKIDSLPIVCDKKLFPKLTERQRRFVEAWCVTHNASEAARIAGYSHKVDRQIGSENMSKPYIIEAIEKYQNLLKEKTGITAEKILLRMEKIAERNTLGQVITDEEGNVTEIIGLDENLAIRATEVQARVLEIGGYARSRGVEVNNTVNNNTQNNYQYNFNLLDSEEKKTFKALLSKCRVKLEDKEESDDGEVIEA